ncbi:MAG: LPS-assembly protein LptD [Hyphomicrobiales bacterium]
MRKSGKRGWLDCRLRGKVSRGAVLACLAAASSLAVPALAAVTAGDSAPPPKFIKPLLKEPPPGTRVDVYADRIEYDGKRKIATATGTVRITYGPYTLTASKVVYDAANDRLTANGSVEFREPNGNVLQAAMVELHNKFKEGFARHLRALLTNDVTITADYAQRFENGITVYERATYTACKTCVNEDGTPIWRIVSAETIHDENERTLIHKNARFEIAGVPVAWFPYLEHPDPSVKRRTGFLIPEIKGANAFGLGLVTPFFWEVAPNADVTFRPMWTTKQGPVADVEWRHRLANGIYSIRGYGVHQFDRDEPPDDERWRGAVTSAGEFSIDKDWSWGWDGTLTSDKTFLRRYNFDDRDLATSRAHLTGMADRNYFSAQAIYFQTLLTEESQDTIPYALPYVRSNYIFGQPVFGGELAINSSAYSLTREVADSPFTFADIHHGTSQSRAVTDLTWQRQTINGLGQVVTPFARLRGDVYVVENLPDAANSEETVGRILPSAGIDMRWPLLSVQDFGQSILTPVFQIIAATDETDEKSIGNEDAITLNFDHTSLFLQDRFTGIDRYEGGTRANAGVVYGFTGANGGFARVSLGESFHIAGDNSFAVDTGLDGTASDLVGAVALQPWENLRFTYQARVEEDFSDVNVQEASLSLTFDRIAGSLSYADLDAEPASGRPEHQEQIWGDASYRLAEAWSLFGGLRYDLESDLFMNRTLGIGFECDCLNARLAYSESRTNDPDDAVDRSIMLSVELHTLGKTSVSTGF